jgi:uncharacterized membrane protein YccC
MSACVSAASFTGGVDSQPASARAAIVQANAPFDDNGRMGWVFLEILVALAIAVAIVWWTIPKKTRRDDREGDG